MNIKKKSSNEVNYIMDFKNSLSEIGISHLISEDKALLDGTKTIGKGEQQQDFVTKAFSKNDSFGETGKVAKHKLLMSKRLTVDNKSTITKPKRKRKACKIESLDKSIRKDFEDAEISIINMSKKRIINASLAKEMPAIGDHSIAFIKQENELLKQKLKDFENLHKIEILKNQITLKTVLRLKTKNEKLRNENEKLEREVNNFRESKKEIGVIVDVLTEHDEEFHDEFKHPIAVTSKVSKLCQKVKELENFNALMISENKSMMKEVEEFIKTNKNMNQFIYDLEKRNENINKELDSVKVENKTLNEKLQQFMDNNNHTNQKILNLTNQNVIISGKLKVTEADNAAKAQTIEIMQNVIENFKKAYLNILQTNQISDTLQPCKKNVSVEATLENV